MLPLGVAAGTICYRKGVKNKLFIARETDRGRRKETEERKESAPPVRMGGRCMRVIERPCKVEHTTMRSQIDGEGEGRMKESMHPPPHLRPRTNHLMENAAWANENA